MRSVTVIYHQEDESWWAEVPDLELSSFVAVADTVAELRALTREGLSFYLDETEIQIDERFDTPHPFILNFVLEPASGIVSALTSVTASVRNPELTAQPRILAY